MSRREFGLPGHSHRKVFEVLDAGLHALELAHRDRKSTRLNSSHDQISYAVFCLKKKKSDRKSTRLNSSHDKIAYAVFCFKKTQPAPDRTPRTTYISFTRAHRYSGNNTESSKQT